MREEALDDVLDRRLLDRLCRLGGARLATRMIDLCLTSGAQRMDALRAGTAQGDLAAVEEAAHSLKSSAGNVGAHAVQDLAQRIETRAAESSTAEIRALVRELEQAWSEAGSRLRQARGAILSEPVPDDAPASGASGDGGR